MLEILLNLFLWFVVGGVAGFYAGYIKRHDPRMGVLAGGVLGVIVGFGGLETGLIDTPAVALITVAGLVAIAALLMPFGDYDQRVSRSARISNLAYALTLPAVLIVFGIVVFPVIWNLLFSFRDLETGDLRDAELFDVSGFDFENYEERLGLTVETPPCEVDFSAALILYADAFNPEDGTQNFLLMDTGIRSDSGLPEITPETVRNLEPLSADTQYILVVAARDEGRSLEYRLDFEGPGEVSLGEVGSDGETVTTLEGATDATFQIPTGTGSRLDDELVEYAAQPLFVSADGIYTVRAEPLAETCAEDDSGNIVYASLSDAGISGYSELLSADLFGTYYVLGARDANFYNVIVRTLLYTIASTFLSIFFGLVAALLVRDAFPGRTVFRGFILFPYIAPVISIAFVWQVMFQQNGPINAVLGMETPFLNPGAGEFLSISVPMIMNVVFQAWRYFPFAFLFLLARIQAIPDDMYEAAKVDGAAPSQRLIYITLPQLRAVFGTLFLLRFIWTFNKFDDIYLLTGPIQETRVITVEIFESLFTRSAVSEASAIAVIMAMMLAVVLMIYFRFFLVEEE